MANIPVERTRAGTPWWLWLLGLILLAGIIWLIAELLDDDTDDEYVAEDSVTTVDPVQPVEPAEPDEGAITTIAGLAGGRTAVGREVDLDGVRVLTVTGDSSYFVGSGADAQEGALVVLENLGESETYAPGPEGADGRYNIDEGDVIDVEGVVAAFDDSVPDYADMAAADRDRALRSGVYINARQVEPAAEDTGVLTPEADQPTDM